MITAEQLERTLSDVFPEVPDPLVVYPHQVSRDAVHSDDEDPLSHPPVVQCTVSKTISTMVLQYIFTL